MNNYRKISLAMGVFPVHNEGQNLGAIFSDAKVISDEIFDFFFSIDVCELHYEVFIPLE